MSAPAIDWDAIVLAKGSRKRGGDPLVRLLSRVEVMPTACWEFQGWRSRQGYGAFFLNGKRMGSHRAAWILMRGPIPEGIVVMHSCDNPPCCNPDHLLLGTVADNNADRHGKGRTKIPPNGGGHQSAKTHCPQGHPYSGDNVRYRSNGRRRCAACYRERARAATSTAAVSL